MLKQLTLFCIFVAVAKVKGNKKDDEIISQCKTDHGISEETKILEMKELTEPNKCFLKCFYEKSGFLGDDGKILIEKIKENGDFGMNFGNKESEILECLDKFKGFKGCDGAEVVHACFVA